MDEEVKVGKEEDLNRNHDITNGASNMQKMNIAYSFWEECKQLFALAYRHSFLYLAKFIFLAMIATVVACVGSDSYHSLIVSSFTLLSGLLFDQLGKKSDIENFDFKRAEAFCNMMALYILIMFGGSILLLILEDQIFPSDVVSSETYLSLFQFKWIMFFVLFSSSFSALVEAIINIPEETLPSRQQKTGKAKSGINIDVGSGTQK